MTNEVLTIDQANYDNLAGLLGQDMSSGESFNLPMLKTNADFEDSDGNELKPGWFTITKNGQVIYAKQIDFRPFLNRFKYVKYVEQKYENSTVQFANFNEEKPDEKGGHTCGRVPRKQWANMPEAEVNEQKLVQCYRYLYGTVTMLDAVNAKGESVDVIDEPVLWRTRGSNFMPVGDVLEQINSDKRLLFNCRFTVTNKREKNGGVTYYVAQLKFNPAAPIVNTTKADIELLKEFLETVDYSNKLTMEKYNTALKGVVAEADAEDAAALDIHDAPFNDELPA